MKPRLLFVCSANRERSPTAEALYNQGGACEARSCGLDSAATPASGELIEWADVIFCMEQVHAETLLRRFPAVRSKKVFVLHIPDDYPRHDPHLVLLLKARIDPILARL
ncbi:MAG: phosphotyrosine protein phosphatase [Verrucomicrobiota bacterium]